MYYLGRAGLNVPSLSQKENFFKQGNKMFVKIRYRALLQLLLYVVVAVSVVSCEDDDIIGNKTDGRIAFKIGKKDNFQSRSTTDTVSDISSKHFPIEINEQEIFLSLTVKDNRDTLNIATNKNESRGAAFDGPKNEDGTGNTNPINPITEMKVTALDENGTPYFTNDVISLSGNKGTSNRFWPEFNLNFFAHAVSKDNVTVQPTYGIVDGEECSGSFSYELPAAMTEEPKKDATNQPDIVFAITPDQSKATPEVEMVFHHALSAIVFKVGAMPDGVTLKSIVISDVYSSGSCTMVSTSSTDKPRDIQFTWTTTGNFDGAYTETLNQNADDAKNFGQMGTNESIFMMIPQEMGETAKLTLNFSINGKDEQIEKNFKDFISAWEADKKYIFTIGLPDEVEVEVSDVVNGRRKENLKITNVGLSTAYIRAKIIGYWVVPDDLNKAEDEIEWYIVRGWNEPEDGIFNWGETTSETETTHWRKHTDGYYYYMSPVAGGMETEKPLFISYELTSTAPVANAQLELIIAAQAVIADETVANFVWQGNPITNP